MIIQLFGISFINLNEKDFIQNLKQFANITKMSQI